MSVTTRREENGENTTIKVCCCNQLITLIDHAEIHSSTWCIRMFDVTHSIGLLFVALASKSRFCHIFPTFTLSITLPCILFFFFSFAIYTKHLTWDQICSDAPTYLCTNHMHAVQCINTSIANQFVMPLWAARKDKNDGRRRVLCGTLNLPSLTFSAAGSDEAHDKEHIQHVSTVLTFDSGSKYWNWGTVRCVIDINMDILFLFSDLVEHQSSSAHHYAVLVCFISEAT